MTNPTPTAELLALSDIDQIALEVARRFTQDTEWQRRANLQVAVIDAIKRARPSLSAQAVGDGWISVNDRLPIDLATFEGVFHEVAVIATDGFFVEQASYMAGNGAGKPWTAWSKYNPFKPTEITHWMPLPPAPGTTPPQPADGGDRVAELLAADRAFDLSRVALIEVTNRITAGSRSDDDFRKQASAQHSYDRAADRRSAAIAKFQPAGGEK